MGLGRYRPRRHVEVGVAGLQVVPGRDQRAVPQPARVSVSGGSRFRARGSPPTVRSCPPSSRAHRSPGERVVPPTHPIPWRSGSGSARWPAPPVGWHPTILAIHRQHYGSCRIATTIHRLPDRHHPRRRSRVRRQSQVVGDAEPLVVGVEAVLSPLPREVTGQGIVWGGFIGGFVDPVTSGWRGGEWGSNRGRRRRARLVGPVDPARLRSVGGSKSPAFFGKMLADPLTRGEAGPHALSQRSRPLRHTSRNVGDGGKPVRAGVGDLADDPATLICGPATIWTAGAAVRAWDATLWPTTSALAMQELAQRRPHAFGESGN